VSSAAAAAVKVEVEVEEEVASAPYLVCVRKVEDV
jgi:hypothetical protein